MPVQKRVYSNCGAAVLQFASSTLQWSQAHPAPSDRSPAYQFQLLVALLDAVGTLCATIYYILSSWLPASIYTKWV